MATLFNEIFDAIRGRCICDESASVAAAEVAELVAAKFTTTNTGSPKLCPHWQVYNRGGSGEFGACDCGGNLESAKLRAGA